MSFTTWQFIKILRGFTYHTSSRPRIKGTVQFIYCRLVLWVKPEVTFIYEIIHSLHYNLEQYHSRYSMYVHHLTLSGAIELVMKHYKRYWDLFSSPPFSAWREFFYLRTTWTQTEAATLTGKQEPTSCQLFTVAAPLKPGSAAGNPHAQVILQLIGELLHPSSDPGKFNSLYSQKKNWFFQEWEVFCYI